MGLGPTEIVILVVAILVLFGAKQIPKWGRALGQTKKELGKLVDDEDDD